MNLIGLRRRWAISNLSEVVRARVLKVDGEGDTEILDADLVVDKRGRAVASFTGDWQQDVMTELWRAAALPVNRPWFEPVTVQAIRQRYPGAVPTLYDEHSLKDAVRELLRPWAISLVVTVLMIVVFFVVFMVAVSVYGIWSGLSAPTAVLISTH